MKEHAKKKQSAIYSQVIEEDSRHKTGIIESSTSCNTFKSADIEPVNAFRQKIKFVSYKIQVLASKIDSNERLNEINEAKR